LKSERRGEAEEYVGSTEGPRISTQLQEGKKKKRKYCNLSGALGSKELLGENF